MNTNNAAVLVFIIGELLIVGLVFFMAFFYPNLSARKKAHKKHH